MTLEPVELIGEGEYNLNALKEIEVTDSYLGLDQKDRGCQNEESQINCKSRLYINHLTDKCGCLPFSMKLFHKVSEKIFTYLFILLHCITCYI